MLLAVMGVAPAGAAEGPADEVARKALEAPARIVELRVEAAPAVTLPLPDEARARIAAVKMPALLPRRPDLLAGVVVTSGPGWYAASMRGDGIHVSIHGFARAHARPELLKELRTAGSPRVEIVDGIVSVSFERYGVGYTLDVECAQVARCADAALALDLFGDLVVAGGAP